MASGQGFGRKVKQEEILDRVAIPSSTERQPNVPDLQRRSCAFAGAEHGLIECPVGRQSSRALPYTSFTMDSLVRLDAASPAK
jgi:hypothetical protein